MYDLLAEHPARITTIVHGHTASAATIIAQAGDVRKMSSTGLYLIHQAHTVAAGTADDLEAGKKTLDTINDQMSEIYARRSGKSKKQMRAIMDRNNGLGEWLTADEAYNLGLIDEITEPMAAAASVIPIGLDYSAYHLPEIPIINKKQEQSMFDWLKSVLNLTEDQTEKLDCLETMETMEARHKAAVEAVEQENEQVKAENEQLKATVAEFEAAKEKYENANMLAEGFANQIADLEAAKADLEGKLEKLTANIKPPVQDDVQELSAGNLVARIKAKMEAENIDYVKAAMEVRNENKEFYNKLIVSKRK
jgi:hypothetical protein